MKKLILILMILTLSLSIYSCGGNDDETAGESGGNGNDGGGTGNESGDTGNEGGDNGNEGGGTGNEGGGTGNESGGNGNEGGGSPVIALGETVYIVAGELASSDSINKLAEALTSLLSLDGMGGAVICESSKGIDGHILNVGTSDDIILSELGKSLLSSPEKSSPYEIAYAIYAEDGVITVVFETCKYAFIDGADEVTLRAIECLTADSDGISLEDGARERGKIDLYAIQSKVDEALVAEAWERAEAELGQETVLALKQLYSLYSDSIADWSASMYSSGYIDFDRQIWVGGYYESTSGRATDGFGPDVEATMQTLTFILQSGMIDHLDGDLKLAIPEEMQRELIYFAKSLQDENGYFYHPQWSKDATNSNLGRRGRDLGWAVSILSTFGARPTYDTPTGVLGDGITADGYLAKLGLTPRSLTESVGVSTAMAVSRVIGAADDNTAFLNDFEEYVDYLYSKDVDTSPYHSTFNATYKQIETASGRMGKYTPDASVTDEKYLQYAGLTMKEILIKYLNDRINPKTGLWGRDWEEYNATLDAAGDTETERMSGTEFKYTNGLHGHIIIYNQWKIPYPYIEEATKSVLEGLMGDEESKHNICELYNQWYCIVELKNNARKYHGEEGEEILKLIDEALLENGAYAVANTYSKLKEYKTADGGFAHNVDSGTSKNQGMPTGLGLDEANVDAVCIGVTGMSRTVFSALGGTRVPIFTASDYMRYLYILDTNPPSLKGVADTGILKFDDGNTEGVSCDGELTVRDGRLTVSENTENILITKSDVRNVGAGILLSFDAIFTADGEYGISFLDGVDEVCRLSFTLADGKLVAEGETHTLPLPRGESVTLSVELVKTDLGAYAYITADGSSISVKLGLSGGRVEFSPTEITSLRLTKPAGELTLDNLLFVQTKDRTHRFDTMPSATALKYVNGSSVPENTLTVTDRDGKSILLYHREVNFDGSQSYFDLMATYTSDTASSVRFETDMKITGVENKSYIEFVLMPYGSSKENRAYKASFTLGGNDDGSRIYYRDSSISGGYTAARDTGITVGEWFNLAIEYKKENDGKFVTRVYINGTLFHETDLVYGTAQEPSAIDSVRFAPHTPFLGEIWFDNMSLIQN